MVDSALSSPGGGEIPGTHMALGLGLDRPPGAPVSASRAQGGGREWESCAVGLCRMEAGRRGVPGRGRVPGVDVVWAVSQ